MKVKNYKVDIELYCEDKIKFEILNKTEFNPELSIGWDEDFP